ncbi:MAG: SurA N-terminal domain-containing protein [Pseudomonadota bacterium]
MLKEIRKSIIKIITGLFGLLIILSFAAFGVPEISDFGQRPALKVGSQGFSAAAIREEFNRQVTSRRAQTEGNFSREDALRQGLQQDVISTLATRAAVQEETKRLGLVMPKDLVREALQNDERFQNPQTNKFDSEWLRLVLQQYDMSLSQFRDIITEDLLREQLVSAISTGAGTPNILKEAIILREIERRDLSYVVVTDEKAGPAAQPTADDLQTYYNENSSRYMAEELRTFTLVDVTNASFEDDVDVDEAQLRKVYDANFKRVYSKPEKRTLYQLTYPSEAEAKAAAESLRQGRSFEELTTDRGVSLESATYKDAVKGDLVDPNIAEAAFSADLSEDGVAGPIEGLFGHVVLQIADITAAEVQAFEDVRDELRSSFLENDTRKRVYDVVEAIENEQDTGANIQTAAEAVDIEARTIGPVDRYSFGPGGEIVSDVAGDVLKEAFAMNEGDESTAVKYSDDSGYFFVALNSIQPKALKDFDLVSDQVMADWRRDEREKRIRNAVQKIEEAVRDEKSLADAAKSFNLDVRTATVDRGPLKLEAFSDALNTRIFDADINSVVNGGAGTDGATAVVIITAVRHDEGNIDPRQSALLDQYLGYQLDQELLEAYVGAVRDDLGVKTNQAQINSIFSDG